MKTKLILTYIILTLTFVSAQTGADILKLIDDNMVLRQAVVTAKMVVHSRSGTRTITSKAWVKGQDNSFVEYLSPAREKGKKMLRLDDKLWNYIPEPTDRIITISGHLLRQSVMGSDLSYEDITDNKGLLDIYTAEVSGSEMFNESDCFVIELKAKTDGVTYNRRKVWVDKKRFLPVREERFAKSGKLLKRTEITDFHYIKGRWYPKKMTFKDMLSRGKGTEYIVETIDFDVDIPDFKFTKAALRK